MSIEEIKKIVHNNTPILVTKNKKVYRPFRSNWARLEVINFLSEKLLKHFESQAKEIEELKGENRLFSSILEGTEKGKTAKENTQLKERVNKYGEHQHFRGSINKPLVTFDEWKCD
jgi:hypothetical protein